MIEGSILSFLLHFTVVHKFAGGKHGSQLSKERKQKG